MAVIEGDSLVGVLEVPDEDAGHGDQSQRAG
jgi:hypothetical protein